MSKLPLILVLTLLSLASLKSVYDMSLQEFEAMLGPSKRGVDPHKYFESEVA